MSEATEPETDPWAEACAEDLAAEQARRRERYGTPPGSAAEELRRLADTVFSRIAEVAGPLAGAAGGPVGSAAAQAAAQNAARSAERAARQFAESARSVVEPVVERNPQVFEHLSAAGAELLAAYRTAVAGHEQRWTRGASSSSSASGPVSPASGPDDAPAGTGSGSDDAPGDGERDGRAPGDGGRGDGDDGPTGTERIDLD